jgi:hypothetical protein
MGKATSGRGATDGAVECRLSACGRSTALPRGESSQTAGTLEAAGGSWQAVAGTPQIAAGGWQATGALETAVASGGGAGDRGGKRQGRPGRCVPDGWRLASGGVLKIRIFGFAVCHGPRGAGSDGGIGRLRLFTR